MSKRVFILNGPNINLLGHREEDVYGTETYESINARCRERAARLGLALDIRQSNHEGVLIDWVHEARGTTEAIVINAAGLTFTSLSLLNALQAYHGLKIEVHMANVFKRESYYHDSYISKTATGIIEGFLGDSYILALEAVSMKLEAAGR